jgi:hypothetical protein
MVVMEQICGQGEGENEFPLFDHAAQSRIPKSGTGGRNEPQLFDGG